MEKLIDQIRSCEICKDSLPFAPRPIIQAHSLSKILVIGQAPGLKVQNSGVAWKDASGDELRRWFGVTKEEFYDKRSFAIVPMGFCYPGKGKSGDLPPRPECAAEWHERLLSELSDVRITFLIGQYSQKYYLGNKAKKNLTETVRSHSEFLPKFFPLVHPSPRNRIWQRKNPWFELDIIPKIRKMVRSALTPTS